MNGDLWAWAQSGGDSDEWEDDSPVSSENSQQFSANDFVKQALPTKTAGSTRFYWNNMNGLQFGDQGGEMNEVCDSVSEAEIDVLGAMEHKQDTTMPKVVKACKQCVRKKFRHSRVEMASSTRSYGSTFKPGGVMMMSVGPVVGRIVSSGSDEMGRWCYTTYLCTEGAMITVVTAYQVCNTSPTNDLRNNPRSKKVAAVTQQYSMMIAAGAPSNQHPRDRFRIDLLKFLKTKKREGHDIMLAGDFNEVLGSDPDGMSKIMHEAVLVDLMAIKLGTTDFNTHVSGTTRIDYVLVSPRLVASCTQAGYEPFQFRFKGDHRGMYVDFHTASLFGNETPPLAKPAARGVHSRSDRSRTQYIRSKYKYLEDHNWFDRLRDLRSSAEPDPRQAEKLDRDWVRASLHAEKQCKKYPSTPYSRTIALKRNLRRLLNIVISEYHRGKSFLAAKRKALKKVSGVVPVTIEECKKEVKKINREIPKLEKNANELRRSEQRQDVETRLAAGDKVGAKAVRNILVAEEIKEMYHQIRAMEDKHDRHIHSLQVPADGDFLSCKTCTEWRNIEMENEIMDALRKRNRAHFGQAQGTFPTTPEFSDKIDWGASTIESDIVLDGDSPFAEGEIDRLADLLLTHFKSTSEIELPAKLTEAEWVGKMKVWNEATSTSPSGLHLGHHKALVKPFSEATESSSRSRTSNQSNTSSQGLQQPQPPSVETLRQKLLHGQVELMNYAIDHKYSFQRWQKIVNFMILKEPGNTKVHRLRVIHLYEADFNLLLGVKWRKLVHHAIDKHLFNEWQFGGLPGRDALTPAFLEELQWEITRASRRSFLRMDFDATSCYDRIIPSLASLAARSFGQHRTLCFIHARTLAEAKYHLKIGLGGVSEEFYQHCRLFPIYGTGQGSANSPVIWVMISSRLFDAYSSEAQGATFVRPDGKYRTKVFIIGFVDDSNSCTNQFENHDQNPTTLIKLATHDAQLWNDLLHRTGGALEVRKCMFHLAHYSFACSGSPVLNYFDTDKTRVEVQESEDCADKVPVKYLSPSTARRTLGCYKSPSGSTQAALSALSKKAEARVTRLANSPLSPKCARRYYHAVFWPSVSYGLSVSALPENKLKKIQNRTSRKFLQKLGYAKTTPNVVLFGPQEYGGLGFHQWYDEQGAGQVEHFLKHWRTASGIQDHLKIALSWAQRLSGMSTPILAAPAIPLPHLETKFFPELRRFLASIDGKLDIDVDLAAPLQREGDFHLMERVVLSNKFKPKEVRIISYCLHFLQVQTLSDITTAGGTHLDHSMLKGKPSLLSSQSTDLAIIQERPTTKPAWDLWAKANLLWARRDGKLHQALGRWLMPSSDQRRTWPYHFDPIQQRLFVRTPDGYTVHTPTFSKQAFCPLGREVLQTLPSTVRPVECESTLRTIHMKQDPGLRSPQTRTTPSDFETYISQLEEWEQRAIKHVSILVSMEDLLHHLAEGGVGVSDGSVLFHQGTFGWTVATKEGLPLLKGKGPAYGKPMDSYRAEAYGAMAILLYVHHVLVFHGELQEVHLSLYCDNKSLVDTVNKLLRRRRPIFPNDTLEPSWDVIQVIVRILKKMENASLDHVKGHQDDHSNIEDLPLPARLNISADQLADELQHESNHRLQVVPMIAGTGAHLSINGETITSNMKKHARAVRSTTALRQAIRKRLHISDDVFDSIDWNSHEMAVRGFQGPCSFLSKFLHNLLPVGKRVHRYDPIRYPNSCPSCDAEEEDIVHFLRCPNTTRRKWQQDLSTALRKHFEATNTALVLQELLLTILFCWFNDTAVPLTDVHPSVHPLLFSQEAIGLDQVFFGRFSTLWQKRQADHLRASSVELSQQNSGPTWVSGIIRVIWRHCHQQWLQRNGDRHGRDEATRQIARLAATRRRLEYLYNLRDRCFPQEQHRWFHPSLEAHIIREPSAKEQEDWIATHEPMIVRRVKDSREHASAGLRTIHEFFSDAS